MCIIRGPGATLWGANAVNGVINIITKTARDTQGGLLTVGGGTEERGFGSVRYGGKVGEDAHFRVYAKYFNRDDSVLPNGPDANDAWQADQAGFRLDWSLAQIHLRREPGSGDTLSAAAAGNSPRNQFSLRSSMDLPWHLALDLALRYVDRLPGLKVGSYTMLDVRLGWRPTRHPR